MILGHTVLLLLDSPSLLSAQHLLCILSKSPDGALICSSSYRSLELARTLPKPPALLAVAHLSPPHALSSALRCRFTTSRPTADLALGSSLRAFVISAFCLQVESHAFHELFIVCYIGGAQLTLLDIVRSRLPTAEFRSCRLAIRLRSRKKASRTRDCTLRRQSIQRIPKHRWDMWAMADIDRPVVARTFTDNVLDRWQGVPYFERTP
ncbi:hypothetical protein BJV74DRAFT_95817 [Russula compacta]|nr:hypothetical protein BJV74DRAFT_95817 [Russula compacta]